MRLTLIALLGLVTSGCVVVVGPTCIDGLRNGNETDVDCGGPQCGPCGTNQQCAVPADCTTGACVGGRCGVNASCTDGIRNGSETDVDCGGSCPAPCAVGKLCGIANDCVDRVCTGGRCIAGSCTDMVKNGPETGVDCGGDCPPCNHLTGSPTVGALTPTGGLFHIAVGMGVVNQAGSYALSGSNGASFRLTWLDGGTGVNNHVFYGSIFTPGTFTSVTPGCANACTLDSSDLVTAPYSVTGGQRVDFDSLAATTPQGFDFVVAQQTSPTPEVILDLYIDGVANELPFIDFYQSTVTTMVSHPAGLPFQITTQP